MNRRLKSKIFRSFNSQADFAQAIGMQEARVSRIVRGRIKPGPEEKRRIAAKLKCKVQEIFGGHGLD